MSRSTSVALFLLALLTPTIAGAHTRPAVSPEVARAPVGVLWRESVTVLAVLLLRVSVADRPTLCDTVLNVLGLSAEPEMVRADAGGIVAGVKHLKSWRDDTACQLPCCAMRESGCLPLSAPKLEAAVAGVWVDRAYPPPARIALPLLNQRPQTIELRSPYVNAWHGLKSTAMLKAA